MTRNNIKFNIPPHVGNEGSYIEQAIASGKISGDGIFTQKCNTWIEKNFQCRKVLLTTSGTAALNMAALLCNIRPMDEVIMPSFTFSSTANAFVLAGAKIVFVDIRPDTMNIDERKIESAITERTKVIVPVHYAGVSCNMDTIIAIAQKYNLLVVEDAAQGVMSQYDDKFLGTLADIGCFSFHETKNFSMGEGGAIVINNEKFIKRAEIIREKGTNRSQFLRGQVDKYTWVDIGDSFLPSELNAAHLWAQLERAEDIIKKRMYIWKRYKEALEIYAQMGRIDLPYIPTNCSHNGHLFYVKLKNIEERSAFISFMKGNGITCAFHYVPLHSAPAGLKYGIFSGEDKYTTVESERLVRLPLYYNLSEECVDEILHCTIDFLEQLN